MTYPATNLNEAVGLIVPDSNAFHNVINGDVNENVTLPEGGEVPTLRKALDSLKVVGDPIGEWTSGVTEFTAYNQYATYLGIPWRIKPETILPYTAQGSNPSSLPDSDFVQPYQENDYGTLPDGIEVQHRRGSSAELAAYTLADGEIIKNDDDGTLHVGDGVTAGGVKHINEKTLGNYTDLVFATVADMANDGSPDGTGVTISGYKIAFVEGMALSTESYLGGWSATVYGPSGGAAYVVVTSAQHSTVRGVVAASCLSNGIDHDLGGDLVALLVTKQKSLNASQVGIISGTGQEPKIQALFDLAATLRTGRKKKRVRFNEELDLDVVDTLILKQGVDLDCNGATIRSSDLTNEDILQCDGDNTVTGGDWYGGEDATVANLRKVRAIHINPNLTESKNVKVVDGYFYNFYITSVYCSGNRNNIPKNIRVQNTTHFGTNKQLQAITIFCGTEVHIERNTIYDIDSLPILVDEATNTTSMDNYGVLKHIHVNNNIIVFDNPTNASVLYGIQVTSCETAEIIGNTIAGLPANTGRAIVATIYDLAQQKNRIENEGEVGPFLPIDERKARLVISNNTITSAGEGIYVGGFTSPVIEGNNVVAAVPIVLLPTAATISGTTYTFPSTDNTGLTGANMEALVKANVLISTDAASEVIKVSSNRNYFLDNVFGGEYSQRYNATNQLSTHVVRDADQSYGVSGTAILGSGVSGLAGLGSGAQQVSVSLVEGSSNLIERFLGYSPTDYIVLTQTNIEGTRATVINKTNDGFDLRLDNPAPASGVGVTWCIIHSEAFRP